MDQWVENSSKATRSKIFAAGKRFSGHVQTELQHFGEKTQGLEARTQKLDKVVFEFRLIDYSLRDVDYSYSTHGGGRLFDHHDIWVRVTLDAKRD